MKQVFHMSYFYNEKIALIVLVIILIIIFGLTIYLVKKELKKNKK